MRQWIHTPAISIPVGRLLCILLLPSLLPISQTVVWDAAPLRRLYQDMPILLGPRPAAAAEVNVTLPPGFNLFALPVEPAEALACTDLRQNVGADVLLRLNAATQLFESCDAVPFVLQPGEGYVLYLSETGNSMLIGEPSCPELDLLTGINLIGVPTPSDSLACFTMLQTIGTRDDVATIQRVNPTTGAFETCGYSPAPQGSNPVGVDFPIQAGQAYLVSLHRAVSDVQLNDPGLCVAPPAELAVSPSRIRTGDVGGSHQLQVALLRGGVTIDVTLSTLTTYASSDTTVVSVTSAGILTFNGEGLAVVEVSHDGLRADVMVEVDLLGSPLVEAALGPAGGVLLFADGTGLRVPPGALGETQTITIDEFDMPEFESPEGLEHFGPIRVLSPPGLVFETPVEFSMAYDESDVPPDMPEEAILIMIIEDSGNVYLDESVSTTSEAGVQEVDTETNTVIMPIRGNPSAQAGDRITTAAGGGTIYGFFLPAAVSSMATPATLVAPNGGSDLIVFPVFKQFIRTPGEPTPVQNRPDQQNINTITLHSTGGPSNQLVTGAVSVALASSAWAHYYIARDGRIFVVSDDSTCANHQKPAGCDAGDADQNSIGIELVNQGGYDIANDGEGPLANEPYSGRQLSALVRLCDFLLRKHPTIFRPMIMNDGTVSRGGIITHAEVQPADRTDPHGDRFRTAVVTTMDSSLEQILHYALATKGHRGLIDTRGGDSHLDHAAGNGGDVSFEVAETNLANKLDPARSSFIVPANTTMQVPTNTELIHLIVNGTLEIAADTTFDLDGIFFVAPTGMIVGTGAPDGGEGHDLTITSDGFALIEGAISLQGQNKLTQNELAPPLGSGEGPGGNGGSFDFQSAAPGPLWVPTIVTRGGDRDVGSATSGAAGAGGDVLIVSSSDRFANNVDIAFEGRQQVVDQPPDFQQLVPADTLPLPAPFNLMPIVVANPHEPPLPSECRRPERGERLLLGRANDGSNISLFRRGLLTLGGIGGAGASGQQGAPGGHGGFIIILNGTDGFLAFHDIDLFTGSGAELLCNQIFIANFGDFKFYRTPSGGLGGRGGFNGGDGGDGGRAGDIDIHGKICINSDCTEATLDLFPTLTTAILGQDAGNPNFDTSMVIGALLDFTPANFRINTTGGSGGSPAGSASGFPGRFGAKGMDGITSINP